MERSLRVYCFIALTIASLAGLFVGLTLDVSVQSARHQLQTVVSTLVPQPWQR